MNTMNGPPNTELLVLRYKGLEDRLQKLFTDLETNRAFQQEFVANPAGILHDRVLQLPDRPSDADLTRANRLLFALLSNPGFMSWATEWQNKHADAVTVSEGADPTLTVNLDRDELFRELAEAIWEHGDREALSAILSLDAEAAATEVNGEAAAAVPDLLKGPMGPPSRMITLNTSVNVNVSVTVTGVAIFVLLIPVIVLGRVRAPEGLDRMDLKRLTDSLSADLTSRAQELRASGRLKPFSSDS